MSTPDPAVTWRTSSYSGVNGNCVEVAPAAGTVLVRDTNDRAGPILAVPTPAWHAFVTHLSR